MTTVEAAASLFGPEELASDPFATLGTDTAASPSTNSETFLSREHIPPSENFNSGTFSGETQTESRPELGPYDSQVASHSRDPSSTNYNANDTYNYNHAKGWYDERGHFQAHEQSLPETSLAENKKVPSYTSASNPYDPYAPKSSYTSPSHIDAASVSHSHSQSPYQSYGPSIQTSSISYSPASVPVPATSPYEPYKPMTASGFQPGVPVYPSASPYAARATVAPVIPPPPVPSVPLNRPKTLNAYDPPFPTSKPARRGVSTIGQTHPTAVPPLNVVGGPYAASLHAQGATYTHDTEISGTTRPTYLGNWSRDGTLPHGSSGHERENIISPAGLDLSRRENEARRTSYQHGDHAWSPHQVSNNDSILRQTTYDDDLHVSSASLPQAYQLDTHDSFIESGPGPQLEDRFGSPAALGPHTSPSVSPTLRGFHSSPPLSGRITSPGHRFSQPETENPTSNASSDPLKHFSVSEPLIPPAVDYYDPKYGSDVSRTSSPTSLANHSRNGSQGSDNYSPSKYNVQPMNPHEPNMFSNVELTVSPRSRPVPLSNGSYGQVNGAVVPNSYKPTIRGQRASSTSLPSQNGSSKTTSPNPYAPGKTKSSYDPPSDYEKTGISRNRSMSNLSSVSTTSTSEDLYAPNLRPATETSGYANYPSSYNHPYAHEVGLHKITPTVYDQSGAQDLLLGPRTQTMYAPSPSLLGSNDPLGRTAARVPVFSFGFGGKLVTCFHGSSVLNTGFDVALSSRKSMDIHIRVLNKIIPESAMDTSTAVFPGPLFSDPGTPVASLVRAGSSTQIKTKKNRLLKYLEERAAEISQGIGYLHPNSGDRRKAEGKFVLVRLLKVMVENDGRLSGTPAIDMAVRAALIPRLAGSPHDSTAPTSHVSELSSTYPSLAAPSESTEIPITIATLRPSTLDKIQEFLLRGERQKAYHYALDEKLWAHAMIIASSIDKEAWKEVVGEFLKIELGAKDNTSRGPAYLRSAPDGAPSIQLNGRESLRVAYSLFSGQGATAVQELLPQSLLNRATGPLHAANMPHVTPMTPNFPSVPVNVPVESLSRWAETAAMMLTNPMTTEYFAALTALGDCLASNHWTEAAHSCYLLAPQTSPIGGPTNPSSRIILLGSGSPQGSPSFHKDSDAIIFTEIVEFALSLSASVKGHEAFNGLPHLQMYKLIRASSLAEIGQMQLANRYCEAITSSLSRASPYFTSAFVEQLKELADRIVCAPHIDKSGSWIGGKMTKPSLDSIGTWLEGRFTKLIAGDGDVDGIPPPDNSSRGHAFSGPFSHYSTISSATPSASPSPQPSMVDLNMPPPRRTGSAMAYPLVHSSHAPIDRASSAMDYVRRRPSPGPRILSANAATTSFSGPPSIGQAFNDYTPTRETGFDTQTPKPSLDSKEEISGNQDVAWWGSSYAQDYSAQTPTATTFMRVDDSTTSDSSAGFISLMDDASISVAPSQTHHNRAHEQEDEEDLGFGNSKGKRQSHDNGDEGTQPVETTEPPRAEPQGSNAESAGSGSWISRWWKRSDAPTPGPIKASLGEETSFVYDAELKRWVNKKAGGGEPPKPAAPPPPSRSQTASPGRSGSGLPNGTTVGPPPARSASAIDLSTSPTKNPMRARSNLVPKSESEAPTASTPPPPPMRPKSQATKRNLRSRYVDVLQEGTQ